VHNYLTKSKTYQGLDWMWKPDEITTAADVKNTAFLTRNLFISPPPFNFSVCIPLKVIFNYCNDYTKVMWGLKHRIRMTRTIVQEIVYLQLILMLLKYIQLQLQLVLMQL